MNLLNKLFGKKVIVRNDQNSDNVTGGMPEERFSVMPPTERLKAIMSLGDTGELKYYELLKYSILHDKNIDVKFAALKRIHLFKNHTDLISFLNSLAISQDRNSLEPYLSMALSQVGLITIDEFKKRINGGS